VGCRRHVAIGTLALCCFDSRRLVKSGEVSWELRAATSFAGLLPDQGHAADATALLQPVYDQFIEGFDTADLKPQKHCSTNCVS
jgi:predicted ATPase